MATRNASDPVGLRWKEPRSLREAFSSLAAADESIANDINRAIFCLPELMSLSGFAVASRAMSRWLFGGRLRMRLGSPGPGESWKPTSKQKNRGDGTWRRVKVSDLSKEVPAERSGFFIVSQSWFSNNPVVQSHLKQLDAKIRPALTSIGDAVPAKGGIEKARYAFLKSIEDMNNGAIRAFPVFNDEDDLDSYVAYEQITTESYARARIGGLEKPADDYLSTVGSTTIRGFAVGRIEKVRDPNSKKSFAKLHVDRHIYKICDGYDFLDNQQLGVWSIEKGLLQHATALHVLNKYLAPASVINAPMGTLIGDDRVISEITETEKVWKEGGRIGRDEIALTNASFQAFKSNARAINRAIERARLRLPELVCEDFWVCVSGELGRNPYAITIPLKG